MGAQASLDRSGVVTENGAAPRDVRPGMSRLAYDFITLCELQFKLLRLDLSQSTRRAAVVVTLLMFSGVLTLCATLLLFGGLSLELAAMLNITVPAALGVVGGAVLLVGLVVALTALMLTRQFRNLFKHSGEELRRNIETIKNGLLHT